MRKKFVQFAALLLVLCALPAPAARAVPAEEDPVIRVGLSYGSSALDGANLANDAGSGFLLGYYDASNAFVALAETDETAISVVKTTNVFYGSANGYQSYHEGLASSVAVGCYHLELPGSYASYSDALAAARAFAQGFVAYIGGAYFVRVGSYLSSQDAQAAQAELNVEAAVKGTSAYGVSAVKTGTDTILFQYDDLGSGSGLGVQARSVNGEKTTTWFKGCSYYGGFRYERVSGGDLTVVNMVSLEDYVKGILPYEMSASWPLEALKAQAVCARSYTVNRLNYHSSYHFDLCATTHCQVYQGTGGANSSTDRAVEETAGRFAWYGDEVCTTFYFSCDGGATESSENVWTEAVPYLRGKIDPYEALVADRIPNYRWTITAAQLKERLNSHGYPCAEIADLTIENTPTGNVYSWTVTDVDGKSWTFSKDDARTHLYNTPNSLRFTVSGGGGVSSAQESGGATTSGVLDGLEGAWVLSGDGSLTQIGAGTVYAITEYGVETVAAGAGSGGGELTIQGSGSGHNVGMSQWGAYAMASQGYTYDEILKFYFTGIEIHD